MTGDDCHHTPGGLGLLDRFTAMRVCRQDSNHNLKLYIHEGNIQEFRKIRRQLY
jgi:hypothetical protein